MKHLLVILFVLVFVTSGSMLAQAVWSPGNVLPADIGQFASAEINATATVVEAIAIEGADDLVFGEVRQGTSVYLAPADGGSWTVTGGPEVEIPAGIVLGFVLPSYLTDGTNFLPISFGAEDATFNGDVFDPKQGGVFAEIAAGEVRIGGTVYVNVGQAAGDYAGIITCMVAYTGE